MNNQIRAARANPAIDEAVALISPPNDRIASGMTGWRLKSVDRDANSNAVGNVLGVRGRAESSVAVPARTSRADLNAVL
jgi:hypothetical protein